MIPLVLFVILLTCIYFFLDHKFNFWTRHGIPHLKPHSWLVGNLKGVGRRNVAEYLGCVYDEMRRVGLGKIAGFYFFTEPALLATDPEHIKLVLSKDFEYFHDRGVFVNEKDDPLSAHLFSLEGAKWKRLRKKFSPTFTSGKMKNMFEILLKVANELDSVIDEVLLGDASKDVEIRDFCSRFTIDIIGSCAFGIECNSLRDPNSEFKEIGMQCFGNTTTEMLKLALMTAFQDFSRCRFTTIKTEKFFFKIIKETMEHRKKHNIQRNDFMDLMIQLMQTGKIQDDEDSKTKGGEKSDDSLLTFNEIAAQCFIFFVAGFETSSTTMSYCLYELAKHQEIQNNLRNHIHDVLAKHNNQITYEALLEMPYLDQVINETLRLYPPLSLLQRKVVKPYKVPGTSYKLNPEFVVFISVYGIQRDEKYFENPSEFNPDRFHSDNLDKIVPFSYIPFGEGPRQCLGIRFGMMQTRLGIVTFLRNFKVTKCDKTIPSIELSPTSPMLIPKHGITLNIAKI
uniref:CSON000236 protein n=1 Tax=Culicoides sonorensis TaxID=179676 RepID=A0A336MGL0_CULSO